MALVTSQSTSTEINAIPDTNSAGAVYTIAINGASTLSWTYGRKRTDVLPFTAGMILHVAVNRTGDYANGDWDYTVTDVSPLLLRSYRVTSLWIYNPNSYVATYKGVNKNCSIHGTLRN